MGKFSKAVLMLRVKEMALMASIIISMATFMRVSGRTIKEWAEASSALEKEASSQALLKMMKSSRGSWLTKMRIHSIMTQRREAISSEASSMEQEKPAFLMAMITLGSSKTV
jgi:hypothetical protein